MNDTASFARMFQHARHNIPRLLVVILLLLTGCGRPADKVEDTAEKNGPKNGTNTETAPSEGTSQAGQKSKLTKRQRRLIKFTKVQLQGIDNALQLYALDKDGVFPEGNGPHILEALTRKQDLNADGIFDDPWLPGHKDVWGNPYNYEWPHQRVREPKKPAVWSNGPNGRNDDGSGDDIVNWRRTMTDGQ